MKKIYQITAALLAAFLIFLNPLGAKADESQYFLISNESVNGTSSQSTGSFQINNESNQNTYKLDYVRPFNVEKNRQNILQDRRQSMLLAVDQVGDNKTFSVANLVAGNYSSINATLKYSGVHANVWVAGSDITQDKASELGREFDNKIYNIDVNNFGNESDVDGNHKVNILCYDIQDGFSGSGGYVAGYFDPRDLYNVSDSNYSEIVYIDTNPLMGTGTEKDVSQAYSTLAHEFQHMINFYQNVFVQHGDPMDVWIDEGLSMAAEQIYSGHALGDRIDYYNNDTVIANGLSFLNWNNNADDLANYSLAYLFMQYLRIQSGQGNQIYKQLINDPNTGYLAVQDLIHKYINPNLSFSKFMNYFREALYFNRSTGRYGFHNELGFGAIQQRIFTGTSLSLDGGGAVVTQINSSIPTDKGSDITYTNLSNIKFQDNMAPVNPFVNTVHDNDTAITGVTESNAVITVTVNGKQLGISAASSGGSYKMTIPKQKAGTTLNVYATDEAGNKSQVKSIVVKDGTPPSVPSVNTVDDNDLALTGKSEVNAKITVTANGKLVSSSNVKADSTGAYRIGITRQKAGTVMYVFATDAAGNKSAGKAITVKDGTAPSAPSVNAVNSNNTVLIGKSERGASITVVVNGRQIGIGKSDSYGVFRIGISRQKVGSLVYVYATDGAGNKSLSRIVKVANGTSAPLNFRQVKVTNNSGKMDTVTVTNLKRGDVIRIYNVRNVLLTGRTSRGASTTLYVKQLGNKSSKIYVTITHPGLAASEKTAVAYFGERSGTLNSSQVKIKNYRRKSDSVTVKGIKRGDDINVYNSRHHIIARKKARMSSVTLYIRQLGRRSGHVYVSISHPGMLESTKRVINFRRER